MSILPTLIDIALKEQAYHIEDFQMLVSELKDRTYDEAQLSAWLMAVCCKGMTMQDTALLTSAMVSYNKELSTIIDKHSTGGVGDSVTLLALPIVAACNVPIIKLSGKMLGFTGGTVDKYLSIPNMRLDKSPKEIIEQVKEVGFYIGMQTDDICIADKIMYELRNRTGSVSSIPLIASSILSKKFSTGAKNLVINLKYGSGAFIKTEEDAELLKDYMETICSYHKVGIKVIKEELIEPLNNYIGTGVEVHSVYDILLKKSINVPDNQHIVNVSIDIAAEMIKLARNNNANIESIKQECIKAITSGKALNKFKEMIDAQNGNLEEFLKLRASHKIAGVTKISGKITRIDTEWLGHIINNGAKAFCDQNSIDPTFGVKMVKHVNDHVNLGDELFKVYYNNAEESDIERLLIELIQCFEIKS